MTATRSDTPPRTVLDERSRTTVYLTMAATGRHVIRVLNDPQPTLDELARFQRDLSITRHLEIPGVRRGLRKDRVGGRHALVLEYAPGQPLRPRVVRDASDLRDFCARRSRSRACWATCTIVVWFTRTSGRHPDSRSCDGRGDADRLRHRVATRAASGRRGQAGVDRGNAGVHLARADGPHEPRRRLALRPLFARRDVLRAARGSPAVDAGRCRRLVHAHLARTPPRVNEVNPAVPSPVAASSTSCSPRTPKIGIKSAGGLAHDLEQCLMALERDGGGASRRFRSRRGTRRAGCGFRRASTAASMKLAALLDAFNRIRLPVRELALVAGDPGVGKSSVVHELDRPIAERAGLFIGGKFDQMRRSVPYSALEQAFRQLVDTLLTESNAAFAHWRETITSALGASSAALLPLVPTLERILGPLPELGDAASEEVQNRFRTATQAFVRAASSSERPLVLFLDDLQWADMASLEVLRWILTDRDGAHVLVIGAYRANEVPSGHPLNELLRATQAAQVPTHTLRLNDLALSDVGRSWPIRSTCQPARRPSWPRSSMRRRAAIRSSCGASSSRSTTTAIFDSRRTRCAGAGTSRPSPRSTSPTTSSSWWPRSSNVCRRKRAWPCRPRRASAAGSTCRSSLPRRVVQRRSCGAHCGRR